MEGVVLTWYWSNQIEIHLVRENDRQYLCWIMVVIQLVRDSTYYVVWKVEQG